MSRHVALLLIFFAAAVPLASGLTCEVGVIDSGGLAFAYGPYLDAKAGSLAEWGASSFSTPGTSQDALFPEWSLGGAYAEIDFLEWIGVRLEPRIAFLGAARQALTDAGVVFDQYGICFTSVLIPVLARGRLPLGPGFVTATAGPFLGIIAGAVYVVDRYAASSTTAALASVSSDSTFFGLSGGMGYALPLGPGVAGLELRADWVFTPIAAARLGNEMRALGTGLAVSYGVRLGGKPK
ncbi:MAG: hypothetical protein ABSF77_19885 [Spirochaetia bacterium]|jgi:hypothetical protein